LSEVKAAPALAFILVSQKQLLEIPVQTHSRFPRLLLAVFSSLPLCAHAAALTPAYHPVALVPFTPGQGSGVAMAIDDRGTVCGMWTGPTGAFCWRDGTLTELQPLPGDDNVFVEGINARGQAVGFSQSTVNFRRRAAVFVDSIARELTIPQATDAAGADIDNAGDVVGAYVTRSGETMAYLFRHGEGRDLGTLGQTMRSSRAAGINNRRQIVGSSVIDTPTPIGNFQTRAFLYQHGSMTVLATPAGFSSVASRINERGQAIGRIERNDASWEDSRAALWDKDGLKVLLDQASDARGINKRGQVVGAVLTGSGGFFYEPGKPVRSLNDLIDTSDGWNIVYAQAINERGQIVGFGCKGELCGPVLMNPTGAAD
jgi:probable HAF family extracellular repeat protein